MRQMIFLVALLSAGTASAQTADQPATQGRKVSARPQVGSASNEQARQLGIRLGQLQLNDLIDRIVAEDAPAGRKPATRLASK